MAVKYHVIPEKRMVVATLNNTSMDAINKIAKMTDEFGCYAYQEKFSMPHNFRAVAVCHPMDTFDVEKGKQIAKKKLMDKYYKNFDSKIAMFRKTVERLHAKAFREYNRAV